MSDPSSERRVWPRVGRAALIVVLTGLALFYLQFGLQALSQHLPQGVLTLVGAGALAWGTVRTTKRRSAAAVIFWGTLPLLVLHAVMTIEDPGELPFLIGSIPVPVVAGAAWVVDRVRTSGRDLAAPDMDDL